MARIFKKRVFVNIRSLPQAVRDEAQPPLAADSGIEQLEGARGGISWILERPLPLGPPQLVNPGKLRVGHEGLPSNLEQIWSAAVQRERNVAHSAQIRRDIITP